MSWNFDYLIVGAGFAGLVLAERMINLFGKTCLIVEKRCHIGGNAYDRYDDHGVLIHPYGPHYFRTNSDRVREYLGAFTEWHPTEYRVNSFTKHQYWNFPINLNTFEQIIGRTSTSQEMAHWLTSRRILIDNPSNSEEVIISQIGWELYEMFFKGYTLKQWNRHPKELDASVCGRIPIRTNRDDRYLKEDFQAMPKAGYTRMFERIVYACGNHLKLLLKAEYLDILPHIQYKHMIYTGPIDEYYDFCHGRLPYRSLRFEAESFTPDQLTPRIPISKKKGFWQPILQVNFPNEEDFTRIVELKHATGQLCENSTIVREFPEDFGPGKEPYYPVPTMNSKVIYEKYKNMADTETNVSFVGRLATYKYINMDQVVGMALETADALGPKF